MTIKQCNDCHILQKKFDEDPENPGWIRSQGVGWTAQPLQYRERRHVRLRDLPQSPPNRAATSTAEYEAKCLKCHASTSQPAGGDNPTPTVQAGGGPPFRTCPVNPSNGCLGVSHAPRTDRLAAHGIDRPLHPGSPNDETNQEALIPIGAIHGRTERDVAVVRVHLELTWKTPTTERVRAFLGRLHGQVVRHGNCSWEASNPRSV